MSDNDILTDSYTKITVVREDTEEIVAVITNEGVTPATGYLIKLTPSYTS